MEYPAAAISRATSSSIGAGGSVVTLVRMEPVWPERVGIRGASTISGEGRVSGSSAREGMATSA